MKRYSLFLTADVTEEMLQSFHTLSRVGHLKPVILEDMMLIPGLDVEDGEIADGTETEAKFKTKLKGKLKKGLKLDKKQLNDYKDKFKWVKPEA